MHSPHVTCKVTLIWMGHTHLDKTPPKTSGLSCEQSIHPSAKMSSVPTLYNAWFCPFAQRAWIALLEKGVEFKYVEQDPYNKTPEWLAINPRGLVPVIVHNGKPVYESPVCIEYVDEAWKTDRNLLPTDVYQRAFARIWSNFIGSKIEAPYYRLLMKKDQAERDEAIDSIVKATKMLFAELDKKSGPFFGGQALNKIDIMLFPYAHRFQVVLPHYRGFTLPKEGTEFERYYQWYAACTERESIKKTIPDDTRLIESYQRYADDSVKSKVADAIRKGTTY